MKCLLQVRPSLAFVVVTTSMHLDLRCGVLDLAEFVARKLDVGRTDVLLEPMQSAGSGDGDDPGLLSEEPGQGDLAGCRALAPGDAGEQVDDRLVVLQGVRCEAGDGAADVVARIEAGRRCDRAGQESLAQRAVRYEADAEFLAGGEDFLLGAAPPQGVLALDGAHGLDGVRAADGAGSGFGQAEVLDLARLDEFLDRSGDVFDGDIGVDAVLVVQVDGVDSESLQGAVDDSLDHLRAAVDVAAWPAFGGVDVPPEL